MGCFAAVHHVAQRKAQIDGVITKLDTGEGRTSRAPATGPAPRLVSSKKRLARSEIARLPSPQPVYLFKLNCGAVGQLLHAVTLASCLICQIADLFVRPSIPSGSRRFDRTIFLIVARKP